MADTPIHYQTLADLCRHLKSGALSATAVTEHMLTRVAAEDRELRSYALVMADRARADAQALDERRAAGDALGPLHGVPIAVKDLLYTADAPTASGTLVMRDYRASFDATVLVKLRAAGAVVLGKTQLTEGAYGMHHPRIPVPRNPWNPALWSGVSSSGSGVAVAAGLAFGAIGSDTGGSIRFPSACNGLVGMKPTYGRVSCHGAFPLAQSLDHLGPMTRTVEDAARMLAAMAGHDPQDPASLSEPVPAYGAELATVDRLGGLTIGVDWTYVTTGVDAPVVATVREALRIFESLGARIVEVTLPASYRPLVSGWGLTTGVECARAHARYFPARRSEYGPALAALLDFGLASSSASYRALEGLRRQFRADFDQLLTSVDMLIAPCMTSLPPPAEMIAETVEDDEGRADFITFTAPFNYSGHPSLTLPAGVTARREPQAFQLLGRRLGESVLFRAGAAYERERGPLEPALPASGS